MDYDLVFAESVRLWQEHKSAEPAINYVQKQLALVPDGELRGRLLLLLGMFQKRTGAFPDALVSHREALNELGESPYRVEVWVSMVEIYVDMNQIEEGYRAAFMAESLLETLAEQDRDHLTPILLNNMGRLALLHHDYTSAKAKFEASIAGFAHTGRLVEMRMVQTRLARALVGMNEYDEAEAICTAVRGCPHSPHQALIEVNLILSKVHLRRYETKRAARAVDMARSHMAEYLGKADWRLMLTLMEAEADLAEAKGEPGTANRLRSLVEEWRGCVYQT